MKDFKLIIAIFYSLFEISLSKIREYGELCEEDIYNYHTYCNYYQNIFCHGNCTCGASAYLTFTEKAQPWCHYHVKDTLYYLKYHECSSPCSDDQYCSQNGICECKDKKILVNHKCYTAVYRRPNQHCYIDTTTAFLCDSQQLTYCSDKGVCTCFWEYFYNNISHKCESRRPHNFARAERRYKFGDFCYDTTDCSVGLECQQHNNTCVCPSICQKTFGEGLCDCGEPKMEEATGVIWCGIILGLLFVWFWICLIVKLFKRFSAERIPRLDQSVASEEAHGLSETAPLEIQNHAFPKLHFPLNDLPPPYSEVISNPRYPLTNASPSLILKNSVPATPPPPYSSLSLVSPLQSRVLEAAESSSVLLPHFEKDSPLTN